MTSVCLMHVCHTLLNCSTVCVETVGTKVNFCKGLSGWPSMQVCHESTDEVTVESPECLIAGVCPTTTKG